MLSVRTSASDTALARIPLRASSFASDRVRPTVVDRAVAVTSSPDSPTRPESPIRFTMAPDFRSAMQVATACVTCSVPVTVTSICGAQSVGVDSRKRCLRVAAELLTSTPIGPTPDSTRSTIAATATSSRRSAPTASAVTPSSCASAAAFSAPSPEERKWNATFAPSAAKASPIARPSP